MRLLLCALACGIVLAAPGQAAPAEERASSAAPANPPPSPGTLSTLSGNHLTGELSGVDCHGVSFIYLGRKMVVALDKLAAAASSSDVVVSPGTGNDRLTGRLVLQDGILHVMTRDLGDVAIPVAEIKCHDLAANGRKLLAKEMSLVTGTGPEAAEQNRPGQAQDSNGNPPTQDQGTSGNPSAQTEGGKSASLTPKEQQEETERETLEFLRNEAVLVQPRRVETDVSLSYLHTNQAGGLGNDKLVQFVAAGRFGIVTGLEGFLQVPLLWGQRQINEFQAQASNELDGLGDIRFGLKYSAINEKPWVPNVVLGLSASAPTGKAPYIPLPPQTSLPAASGAGSASVPVQVGDTRDPLNVQLGTGHWILTGSATALKSYDPIVLFATVNYSHYIPATYYGVHIVPGDIWELNSGFGFSINDAGTFSTQVFIDYDEKWQFGGNAVPQTQQTPISLRLAYTHVLTPFNLIEPSVTFGLTRDATDAMVALDYIHRF
ncbi:MAG TPA: hypothetical protein VJ487_19490 [Alphaproteobacteria bacterium]|nr:hypothetical protein [Alphaproteobacteria bacterium]